MRETKADESKRGREKGTRKTWVVFSDDRNVVRINGDTYNLVEKKAPEPEPIKSWHELNTGTIIRSESDPVLTAVVCKGTAVDKARVRNGKCLIGYSRRIDSMEVCDGWLKEFEDGSIPFTIIGNMDGFKSKKKGE